MRGDPGASTLCFPGSLRGARASPVVPTARTAPLPPLPCGGRNEHRHLLLPPEPRARRKLKSPLLRARRTPSPRGVYSRLWLLCYAGHFAMVTRGPRGGGGGGGGRGGRCAFVGPKNRIRSWSRRARGAAEPRGAAAEARRGARAAAGRSGPRRAAAGAARPGRTGGHPRGPAPPGRLLRSAGVKRHWERDGACPSAGGGGGGREGGERLFSRVTEKLQTQIHVSFAKDYVYKRLKSFSTPPRQYSSDSFLGVKEQLEVSSSTVSPPPPPPTPRSFSFPVFYSPIL